MTRLHILLSPHFDDAVLSLGGLLAKEGPSSIVMTFFGGKPEPSQITPWDLASGFLNSNQAHDARLKENDEALKLLDIPENQIVNLAHLDQQYRADVFGKSDDEELSGLLLQDLLSLLESYGDQELNLYAPGLEMHKDHFLIKRVLLEAIPHLKGKPVEFFLYQDLPYAYNISEENLQKNKITDVVTTDLIVVPLSREQMEKKIEAIKLYKSQIGPLELFKGNDLPSRVMGFSSRQARQFAKDTEYCEVLYKIA